MERGCTHPRCRLLPRDQGTPAWGCPPAMPGHWTRGPRWSPKCDACHEGDSRMLDAVSPVQPNTSMLCRGLSSCKPLSSPISVRQLVPPRMSQHNPGSSCHHRWQSWKVGMRCSISCSIQDMGRSQLCISSRCKERGRLAVKMSRVQAHALQVEGDTSSPAP